MVICVTSEAFGIHNLMTGSELILRSENTLIVVLWPLFGFAASVSLLYAIVSNRTNQKWIAKLESEKQLIEQERSKLTNMMEMMQLPIPCNWSFLEHYFPFNGACNVRHNAKNENENCMESESEGENDNVEQNTKYQDEEEEEEEKEGQSCFPSELNQPSFLESSTKRNYNEAIIDSFKFDPNQDDSSKGLFTVYLDQVVESEQRSVSTIKPNHLARPSFLRLVSNLNSAAGGNSPNRRQPSTTMQGLPCRACKRIGSS